MLSARIHEYYKQYTHYGGTKDPLIVHWPEGIKDGGKIRPQFHHAIRYNLIVTITRWEYASKQLWQFQERKKCWCRSTGYGYS